jgi:hypothetical protein
MRLSWLLVLAACGGGVAFDDFDRERIEAQCEYLVRCEAMASMSDCRAFFARTAIDNPNPGAALEAGKLRYDEHAARACLDAIANLSCDSTEQTAAELAPCSDVLTGTGKAGSACAFDGECESDSCVVQSCPMACCTGSCGPPRSSPGVGQPCVALCADGAYCGADSVCHALQPAGAACNDLEPCAQGLYCAGAATTGSGSCTPLPKRGQPCETACAHIADVCIAGTCVAAGLPGAACMASAECSSYYTCTDGQCASYPTRGMTCTGRCSDESWCSGETCIEQKANGEPCTYNDECRTHYCSSGNCGDVPLCI